MRFIFTIVLFLRSCLFAVQTDFDVAIVGTSPIAMLEAIYHIDRNERVLILEAEEQCGGAWKSIDICGIAHADLGCHLIGSDQRLKEFFEKYFGCKFVCLNHSDKEAVGEHARCPNGFYFSKGCHELISKLKGAIDSSENARLINQRLDSIYVDKEQGYVELTLGCRRFTTAKLMITSVSDFRVENPGFINHDHPEHNYDHLYILVEDPTPSRFTYINGITAGMSRAMNLTPFLEMPNEGLQLIVIQTHGQQAFENRDMFLEAFKSRGLLDANAKIVAFDTYAYYQTYSNTTLLLQFGGNLIEMLDTSSFVGMSRYLDKWKGAMIPLKERKPHGKEEGIEGLQ